MLGLAPAPADAQVLNDGLRAVEITDSDRPVRLPQHRGRSEIRAGSRVGRQAAAKYMSPKKPDGPKADSAPAADAGGDSGGGSSADHYLAVHVGWFVSDSANKWGAPDSQNNVGRWNLGVTYRMGEWTNSMDLLFRFDAVRINLSEGSVTKYSFLPMISFPDASSRFPLYFGAGVGLGVFGNQLASESSVSLDYQLVGGARFFNLWSSTGLFVEAGIKNHVFLLSDGQFNGVFIASGLVFTF